MLDYFDGPLFTAMTAVPVLYVAYKMTLWMVSAEIDVLTGVLAIFVGFSVLAVSAFVDSVAVRAMLFVMVTTAIAFFPFAVSQMDAHFHREQDTDELQRAHDALERDPGNAAARFEIARVLHKAGLVGHAIAIADATAKTLPAEQDPLSNRSLRDMFRSEIYRLEGWKQERIGADAFRPVACPRCKRPNPAGTISCQGCGGPFLLDLARKTTEGERMIGRLVLCWVIVGAAFCAGALVGMNMEGWGRNGVFIFIFAAAGWAIANILNVGRLRA